MFLLTAALTACADPAGSPVGPRALVGRILDDQGRLEAQGWRYLRGAISPDGRSVAFLGGDPQGRSRVGLARAGKPVAISPTDLDMTDFAWMPDSRSLLVDYTVRGEGGQRLDAFDIIGLDTQGTGRHTAQGFGDGKYHRLSQRSYGHHGCDPSRHSQCPC
jgi:hypothetical protein